MKRRAGASTNSASGSPFCVRLTSITFPPHHTHGTCRMKALRPLFLCTLTAGLGAGAVLFVGSEAGGQPKKKNPPPDAEYKSGIVWPEPVVVTPGKDNGPPSDAIVLFDGKDLSKWKDPEKWILKDGYAISAKGDL